MVYYRTDGELSSAFRHMVGHYNAVNTVLQPDSVLALELAALKPGESVLELGTASGHLLAQAKLTVGAGVCVGVDAVQDLLDIDFAHTLREKGLTVYPQGTAVTQVHKLRANITNANLGNRVRALPGTPQTYDCIFAVHVFPTIPSDQRLQTLRNMRRFLAPNGRIVMDMSARFAQAPPSDAEAAVPTQFRTSPHTEAPGSLIGITVPPGVVSAPQGPIPAKVAFMTNQLSPDRFWVIAREQATHAAERAGFFVTASRDIGKGDRHGLPLGARSPPQSQLESMPTAQIVPMLSERVRASGDTYCCTGRSWDTLMRRTTHNAGSLSSAELNCDLVRLLQRISSNEQARVAAHQIPGTPQTIEFVQLGVLVSMRLA